MVFADLLPSKHSLEIGFLHARIMYCIGKIITFIVGTIIQDEIFNQAEVTNHRIGLPFDCLKTQMVIIVSVPPKKDSDTTRYISNIGCETISRSSTQTSKKQKNL